MHQHRIGGPAVISNDGVEWWMKNGDFHREDGPTVLKKDSSLNFPLEYHINGINLTEKVLNLLNYGLSEQEALSFCIL